MGGERTEKNCIFPKGISSRGFKCNIRLDYDLGTGNSQYVHITLDMHVFDFRKSIRKTF